MTWETLLGLALVIGVGGIVSVIGVSIMYMRYVERKHGLTPYDPYKYLRKRP